MLQDCLCDSLLYHWPMSKTSTIVIVLLLVIIALLAWLLVVRSAEAPTVTDGTTTTPQPPPVPRQPNVSAPTPAPLHERVSVTSPKPTATVGKKFSVTGKAPGNWFFEASAPVMVRDLEGNKLAQSYVQAQGEWMTTELVDFKGDIEVTSAYKGPAVLVMMKDNPSGLPENDDSLEIPITIQ